MSDKPLHKIILEKMWDFCKSIAIDVRSEINLMMFGNLFLESDCLKKREDFNEIKEEISKMTESLSNTFDTASAHLYLVGLAKEIADKYLLETLEEYVSEQRNAKIITEDNEEIFLLGISLKIDDNTISGQDFKNSKTRDILISDILGIVPA